MKCCMLVNLWSLGPCKHRISMSGYQPIVERERVIFFKTKTKPYYFKQKGNKIYTRYL